MAVLRSGTNRIELVDGTRTVWASDAAGVSLLPSTETITLTSKTISFPDFVKGNMMGMGLWAVGSLFDSSGISIATILPGEYGPTKTGSYLLAEELIGTVPTGTNHLDIRTTLTWTTPPDDVMTIPVEAGVPLGEETYLVGGCALLETVYAFRRIIKFELSGTNLYLRRYQSVPPKTYAVAAADIKSDPQTWTSGPIGAWGDKWTHGGDFSGHLAFELDRKETGNVNKQRGGSNAPSTTDISDFSSVWTGNFTIRPGIVHT